MKNIIVLNPSTLGGSIVYAVALLICAVFINRMLRLAVERALARGSRIHIDRTRVKFISQLAQITVYIVTFFVYARLIPALSNLGNAGLASVGVLSVVAGLAAQNTLGNLISGISLLLYRPFNVGDRLQVTAPTGLETGVIESLNLGYTILKTDDNRRVVVPNSIMAGETTINLTRDDPRVACSVALAISLETDIDQARAVLIQIAGNNPKVQKIDGCPVTRLDGSGFELSLCVWCADSGTAGAVKCELLEAVKRRFSTEGIALAPAQRMITAKN
ncbi:MAG: mechanosensitive ion channel family protein [Candidatus Omnitrophica bacterium]|nr:mechanosensitive ion channel family protein [Candidatus Omnitrophota bacterium]MDE2010512.1 mechanosensitive ion channel family protein [Candidatus Omnitrophota bacterium]MDE2214769.1 mechanosensitive ion channel family protein [Candidatus Omnitrophota bacterium]MDE2231448.1 mechanosensitive ion channel family protein [Candidatus Omnitrophota bacterium]